MSTAFAHTHHAEANGHEASGHEATGHGAAAHEATADEVTVDTATIAAITEIEAEVVVPARHARITWSRPDTGLWAANYGGYYGGTVDRQGAHFFVSDTFGQYVGDFRSLEEAQQRLADRLRVLLPDVRR